MIEAMAGAVAGGVSGWFISRHVSRFTGGVCPILCKPAISIPYFAVIGIILAMEFTK